MSDSTHKNTTIASESASEKYLAIVFTVLRFILSFSFEIFILYHTYAFFQVFDEKNRMEIIGIPFRGRKFAGIFENALQTPYFVVQYTQGRKMRDFYALFVL